MNPISVVEILGPAEQGVSRPYRCRGEDGLLYYVKGGQTDRHSLWSEWLCGHLALAFGLKIPPFKLMEISEDLLMETRPELRNIGAGIAFGSQHYPNPAWFEPGFTRNVDQRVQRDILVFDWWISNQDRMRTNPNLLWNAVERQLVVIDHNQAFDPDFSAQNFADLHVFSEVFPQVYDDLVIRDAYAARLSQALDVWQEACDNAPPEWHWANPERDVPANFKLDVAKAHLDRCMTSDLWRMV